MEQVQMERNDTRNNQREMIKFSEMSDERACFPVIVGESA